MWTGLRTPAAGLLDKTSSLGAYTHPHGAPGAPCPGYLPRLLAIAEGRLAHADSRARDMDGDSQSLRQQLGTAMDS